MDHAGELAALATAGCWATSSLFFETGGKRIGSMVVNLLRLLMAMVVLVPAAWLWRGQAFPVDATPDAWLWLVLSGLVGFLFGDLCLFRAFVVIGPRLSQLMMSLAPPMTAAMGWLVLGESLSSTKLLGMALTLGGVVWAIRERTPRGNTGPVSATGILLALGGALGQAGGLVLSKLGMGDYDPVAATQIRIFSGVVGFSLLFTTLGWWPRFRAGLRDREGVKATSLGAIFGPFLGVTLSLVAVQHTHAAVAASIMATAPILVIPLVVVFRGEQVTATGVMGTLVAVAGVIVLFL
jgi:drug/metabolite transporter (DMT)-like permease